MTAAGPVLTDGEIAVLRLVADCAQLLDILGLRPEDGLTTNGKKVNA